MLEDYEYPDPDEADDDEVELVPCPECGAQVYEEAEQCPVCGTYIVADSSIWAGRPAWWVVLGVLGVIAMIWALVGM